MFILKFAFTLINYILKANGYAVEAISNDTYISHYFDHCVVNVTSNRSLVLNCDQVQIVNSSSSIISNLIEENLFGNRTTQPVDQVPILTKKFTSTTTTKTASTSTTTTTTTTTRIITKNRTNTFSNFSEGNLILI